MMAQPPPSPPPVPLPFPWEPLQSLRNGPRLAEDTGNPSRPTPIRYLLPRIGITSRTLKKLEAIQLVREQRDSRTQQVSYNARPFVLCGLPLRRPPQTSSFMPDAMAPWSLRSPLIRGSACPTDKIA